MRAILLIAAVIRHPSTRLPGYLAQPHAPLELLRHVVMPLASIRAVAILLRSLAMGSGTAGCVLAVGSYLLQIGTWLGLSLALPILAGLSRRHVSERQAMLIAAMTCAPLWLAGVLFAVPDNPPVVYAATRCGLLAAAAYGVVMLRLGVRHVAPQLGRLWIFAAGAYVVVYSLLFIVVGISATVLLYVLRAS